MDNKIRIEKITEDNFEIIICDKLKGILNKDETLELFFDLARHLDYEVRDK